MTTSHHHHTTAASRGLPVLLTTAVAAVLGFGQTSRADSIRFLPLGEEIADRKIGLQDGKALTPLGDLNPRKRSKAYP